MKTLNFIPVLLALLVLLVSQCFANNEKYVEAMRKNIAVLNEAKTISDFQNAVNGFERIGSAEKTKWEPFYYAGFGYIMMATREQNADKKDGYLDQAVASVSKAKEIAPNESEVSTLEGFIHTVRVSIDPASRGPLYASQAMLAFGKALALNPDNPRALALMGQMQFGTAQFFGSPVTEACDTIKNALEKFDTFKSENPLAPQWGRQMAENAKKQCDK